MRSTNAITPFSRDYYNTHGAGCQGGNKNKKAGTNPALLCTRNTAAKAGHTSGSRCCNADANARSSDSYAARLLTRIIIIHAGRAVKGEIKQKAGTNPALCCNRSTAAISGHTSASRCRNADANARSSDSYAARLLTRIIIIHAGGAVKGENKTKSRDEPCFLLHQKCCGQFRTTRPEVAAHNTDACIERKKPTFLCSETSHVDYYNTRGRGCQEGK